MSLHSLRELLIKKADNPEIENLIHFLREDVLTDMVLESLEKMAQAKHKGDSANVPIRDFGVEMDPETEPKMLHDALSHHASQYKAALAGGNQDVANAHAKQIFRLTDLAHKAEKHSNGKLSIQAVPVQPWERQSNLKTLTADSKPVQNGNRKIGEFVTNTKGWGYRGKDYSFLQGAPHESYGNEVRKHGHNKAYPLEQMKVNGKFLDIEDVSPEDAKTYKEHPFDKHPIMNHFEEPASQRSPERDAQYRSEHSDYQGSPHMDEYFSRHETKESANPAAYERRGEHPSAPVHRDVEGLDVSKQGSEQGKPTQPKAAPAAAKQEMSAEDKIKTIDSLNIPQHLKDAMKKQVLGG